VRQPIRSLSLAVFSLAFSIRTAAQVTATRDIQAAPSLILLITADQFRADYLDRFGSQLTGGLARLARGGAWFTNAHHDHGITETAPGHATLLSGRFPRSTGIMSNRTGVDDPGSPLLGGGVGGASPFRFQGTTLVDWLRTANSQSRSLSVSMKDRAAILPIGRLRTNVFWYAEDGRFTTSRYYLSDLPAWVGEFNARQLPQSFAGKSWTLLLPDSAYREPDSVSIEMGGAGFTFPHTLPLDPAQAASQVRITPWMDKITLAFALQGLQVLALGGEPSRTDVVAISLSATDVIGHGYGPDSREIHDQVLRLDRELGGFIDSVFKLRDSTRVAIVFVADHGVGTIPELAAKNGVTGATRVNLSGAREDLHARAEAAGLDTTLLDVDQQVVLVDRNALKGKAPALDSVLAGFAAAVRAVPGVARVDRFRDLVHGDTVNDPLARRWIHEFPAASNVELVITLSRFSTFGGNVASHGSPYDYDSHVPLIFYGPWFRPGRYPAFVRTVDLAPTLAQIAKVRPTETLDGVVLSTAIK
jgi:predicted AlkP superfamily pyrophosphatase or phosphodiesterase